MSVNIENIGGALGDIRRGTAAAPAETGEGKSPALALELPPKEPARVSLKSYANGESVTLAWAPAKVSLTEAASMQSYDIITRGEAQFPQGMKLARISWESTLPGERTHRAAASWIVPQPFEPPKDIMAKLRRWQTKGDKLLLGITPAAVALDVYLVGLEYTYQGGAGDVRYSVSLVKAEPLEVKSVAPTEPALNARPSKPPDDVVTIKEGDTMWDYAEQYYGDGSQWPRIQEANPDLKPRELSIGGTMKIPH